jgi:DNA uptake protein ComE-like DNA-binding protein
MISSIPWRALSLDMNPLKWFKPASSLYSGLAAQLQPLKTRIQSDPYYRFQSLDEIRLAAELGVTLDVNHATVDDWLRLPGMSIHQARSLHALSQSGVQFHCAEDIAAALGVPMHHIQGYLPILRFYFYDPASPCVIQRINANTATVEQLARIPDVDLFLARALVDDRQVRGRYQNIADVQQRLQLPPALVSELMHYLCF